MKEAFFVMFLFILSIMNALQNGRIDNKNDEINKLKTQVETLKAENQRLRGE